MFVHSPGTMNWPKVPETERDTARPLITLGWHILGTRCLGGWARTSGWGLRFQPSQWRTPYTDGAKVVLTHSKITTAHARVATTHRYVQL